MRYAITAGLLGLGLAATALVATPGAEAASGVAPGAPGATALWTAGDKDGFGTATTSASKAWYTLDGGELTEVYYARSRHAERSATCSSSSPTASRGSEREREDADHIAHARRPAQPHLPPGQHRPARAAGGSPRPT